MFTRLFTRQQWAIAQQKLLKKIEFYFALVIANTKITFNYD